MQDDLKRVYEQSLAFTRVAAIFSAIVAGFFGLVGLVVGTALYAFVGLPPAAIFWAAGLAVAAVYGWRAWRDLKGEPVVLEGTLVRKERAVTGGGSSGRSVRFFLHLDVSDAFAVTPEGGKRPLSRRLGSQKVRSQPRLYDDLEEGQRVSVVCTPSGEAVTRPDDTPAGNAG